MPLAPHIETFTDFATRHLAENEAEDGPIRLKIAHSMHVLDNAGRIAQGESLPEREGMLCRVAALYHDIGRFPQFARYRTFNDRESVNHGRLGVLTLRDIPLPGDLSDREWRIVRFAIAQHNLKSIRPILPARLTLPTRVVRDADKIDIFRVMIEHFKGPDPDPVVTHGFTDVPGRYSDAIYESVMAEKTGDYRLVRFANDFKILAIGWLYDLNFTTSIRLLAEYGYIAEVLSMLPKDDKIKRLEEKANTFLHYKNGLTP